jgi:hypothetical protein
MSKRVIIQMVRVAIVGFCLFGLTGAGCPGDFVYNGHWQTMIDPVSGKAYKTCVPSGNQCFVQANRQ